MIPELPRSASGRRALVGLGVLAAVKLTGWILIAVSLARGISHLASALPASDAAQLLHLLFNSPKTAPGLVESLIEYTTSTEFLITLALGFGGAVLRGVAQWGQQVLATRAALGEKEQLRAQLVQHRLAAAGAHADRAGEDTVLASKGLDGLDDYYTDFLPSLVSALIIPLGLGIWILLHDWISAAVLLLTIPLIPMFMILIGRFTEHRVDEAADGLNRLSQHLLELARGLPVLVGLRRAGTQRKALQDVSERYQRTTMNTLKAAFMSGLALELISTLSVAIIAVFIGVRLVNGSMELYAGIMVLTLAAEVYLPFRDIGSAYHASEDGVEALKRARAQIHQPVPKSLVTALDTTSVSEDAVELTDLTIAYKTLRRIEYQPTTGPEYLTPQQYADAKRHRQKQGPTEKDHLPQYEVEVLEPVVEQLSLRLEPGQYTVLGEASGTGKSTILKALAGLLTDAEAQFDGHVTGLAGRHIAYLGQHPAFIAETVTDELTMVADGTGQQLHAKPDTLDIGHILETSLAAAGLESYQDRHIDELSPGERRRLGFARVIARLLAAASVEESGPSWFVILDEPTAHLDDRSASRIRQTLEDLARGTLPDGTTLSTMVLVASHDRRIHAVADQLIGDSETISDIPDATSPTIQDRIAQGSTESIGQPRQLKVTLRDWWRILPVKEPRFIAGIGWAVAALLSAALLSALSGWLIVQASYEPPILYLLAVIVGVRFFGIGRAVFRYAERLAVHDAVLSWANRIRLRVWDALGSQATQWHQLTKSGGALSVLISDVDQLRDAVPRVIVPIPAAIITWAAATGIVAYMAPGAWWPSAVAGLAAFIVVPALVHVVDAKTSARLAEHRTGVVSTTSRLLTAAADMVGNGMAYRATQRFIDTERQTTAPLKRNATAAGLGEGLTSLIAGWAAVQTMWVAITQGISAPNTALVVMLMLALAEPFGLFNQATQESKVLNHQLGKLLPLLHDDGPSQADWVQLRAAGSHPGITAVEIENATVSYGPGQPSVLEDFSLRATTGDFVVVTGPSGTGKSTLLAVLLGFLAPQTGTYRLTANEADAFNALQHVAWCPQEAYLFDSTLRSNLALAREPARRPTDEECQAVLQTVGLGEWLAEAPQGLDTRLGPSGHFISGGQRQRVAVARALLADAHVVLLDEPTAHLGADEAAELISDLKVALQDKIVVMVTHDERFADLGSAVRL